MTPADKAIRKRCCILYFSMQCDQLIQHNETCKISYIISFYSHYFPYGKTDAIRLTTKDLIKKKDLQCPGFIRRTPGEKFRYSAIWLTTTEAELWPPLSHFSVEWWRPAEHGWLRKDSGAIPLHACVNHPQQPPWRWSLFGNQTVTIRLHDLFVHL